MKRNYLGSLLTILLVALMSVLGIVSCNNDDDGGDGSADGRTGVVDVTTGLRLVRWEDGNDINNISYSEDGIINRIEHPYGFGNFADTYVWNFEDKGSAIIDYNNKKSDIMYDRNGYITKIAGPDEVAELSYDGRGHLTTAILVRKYSRYDETTTINLTWKDGLLTEIAQEDDYYTSDGHNLYPKHDAVMCTYHYANTENKYKQYTRFYGLPDFSNLPIPYSYLLYSIGLFGNGPDILPAKIFYRYSSPQNSFEGDWTYEYELNADGSIAKSRETSSSGYRITTSFTYDHVIK